MSRHNKPMDFWGPGMSFWCQLWQVQLEQGLRFWCAMSAPLARPSAEEVGREAEAMRRLASSNRRAVRKRVPQSKQKARTGRLKA